MSVTGMAVGTVGMFLLAIIEADSNYGGSVAPLILLGLALGAEHFACDRHLHGIIPRIRSGCRRMKERYPLKLGGALGIAVLGSLLGTTYRDELTNLVGDRLPSEAMEIASDSVGGGLGVAQQVMQDPAFGPQQAQALVDAVHQAFAQGVAQASMTGGIIMAIGTLVVLAVLPNRRKASVQDADSEAKETAGSLS